MKPTLTSLVWLLACVQCAPLKDDAPTLFADERLENIQVRTSLSTSGHGTAREGVC